MKSKKININPETIYWIAAKKILQIIDKDFKEEITKVALRSFTEKLTKKTEDLTIDEAVILACHCCEDINPKRLYVKDRRKQVVVARWLAMWYVHKYHNKTLKFVGELFGKDHATALHGNKKIDSCDKKELGPDIFDWISKFKNAIN